MPIRINFSHVDGVSFYEVAPRSKKHLPEGRERLPRWALLRPPGVLWHRLPEAQAASWEDVVCRLTGFTRDELPEVEIFDVANRRELDLPRFRLVPALSA